jgi:hypothetical protein
MTDEREEEAEFLAGLKARTGRDLAEWMAAITSKSFADKNETIDWLREQGLPFARASWLERIHRNGGKPIYSDTPAKRAPERQREPEPRAAPPAQTAPKPMPPASTPPRPSVSSPAPAPSGDEAARLEKLIAAAKGYRPLFHLLEAEVRKAIPALTVVAKPNHVSFGAPAEFAAVMLHASEIRLGLDLGDRPFGPLLQKSKLKGPGPAITHMAVLNDARQVNEELIAAVKAANARVNG